jgi:hypothetical protein
LSNLIKILSSLRVVIEGHIKVYSADLTKVVDQFLWFLFRKSQRSHFEEGNIAITAASNNKMPILMRFFCVFPFFKRIRPTGMIQFWTTLEAAILAEEW